MTTGAATSPALAGMPRRASIGTLVVVAGTLGVAAASWVITVRQLRSVHMAAATGLGSLSFFMGMWVPMMAAMMLPGALPAVSRRVGEGGRAASASLFAGSYVALWAAAGLAVFVAYRPPSALVAGVLTVAAGGYELTPLKRDCRRRCRESVRSGLAFGRSCVGSSAGLMVMLVALGVMNVTVMAAVAVVVLAQKVLPPRASVDVPVALAIVGLGVVVSVAPASVPGLFPAM